MFSQDGYTDLFVARLFDFFHRRSPWQRRLWRTGLVLELREVAEYSRVLGASAGTTEHGLKYVSNCVLRGLVLDQGVTDEERALIKDQLELPKVKGSEARSRIVEAANSLELTYLQSWKAAVTTVDGTRPDVELASRALASHLLDGGFSSDHLHRWLTYHKTRDGLVSLGELYDSAIAMARSSGDHYEVLVPFEQLPDVELPATSQFQRLSGPETTEWLDQHDTEGLRYSSALTFEVEGRDPWAAVERASEIVARLRARATVGHPGQTDMKPSGAAFLAGKDRRYGLAQPRRQVEVGAITRQGALFDVAEYGASSELDDALELAATLEEGAPGAAISGGWAAVEGLLSYSDVRGDSPKAADRLAALVACSYPRAELTTLSYRHEGQDALNTRLGATTSNRDRCVELESWFRDGNRLALSTASDRAAEERMLAVIDDPGAVLARVRDYATQTLRRLFNQRNLIMHSGTFRHVALDATLRTAPGLVGAGLDRIVHASLESRGEVTALTLAARAENELELLSKGAQRRVSDLLELR